MPSQHKLIPESIRFFFEGLGSKSTARDSTGLVGLEDGEAGPRI